MVRKRTKAQTLIDKTLHKKTNDLATRIQIKMQGSPEGLALPVQPVAPSILLVYDKSNL